MIYYNTITKESTLNKDQKLIIEYLHGLSSNIHSELVSRNYETTIKFESEFEYDKTKKNSKSIQQNLLMKIKMNPKPFYQVKEDAKTVRIHSVNESMIGLKREIRKKLCESYTEADLKASQFAILAAHLRAPTCQEFIKTGKSLWKEFNEFVYGIDKKLESKDKEIMKTAIYSIAFGKGKRTYIDDNNIIHQGVFDLLKSRNLEKLITHPIIEELFKRRDLWFKAIGEKGGWNDAYGVFNSAKRVDKNDLETVSKKGCRKGT